MLTSYIRIGHAPADTARERRTKSVFALAMLGAILFCAQLVILEEGSSLELIIDALGLVGTVGALAVLQVTKRTDLAYVFAAALLLVVLTAALLVLGNRTGDLSLFAIVPVFAIALLGARQSLFWFAVTVALVLFAVLGDPLLPDVASTLHQSAENPQGLLFHGPVKELITPEELVSFLTALTMIFALMYGAYRAINQANERVESLLLNMLPPSIAARLTNETHRKLHDDVDMIADEFSEATILFADIVGFTDLAARTETAKLMRILDEVFTEFDHLAEKHKVEKIKTIGDAYMAVCGLPELNPDHAQNIADMALEMVEVATRYGEASGLPVRLRIGINSGPVIAGIIGRKKFIYDLWGDAVNVASRMESHGEPGKIQVSSGTYETLKNAYEFRPLGQIEVKGKGQLPAWHLVGRRGR